MAYFRYAIQNAETRARNAREGREVSFSIIRLKEGEPLPEGYEMMPAKDNLSDGLLPDNTPTYPPGSKYYDPNTFEEKTVPTNLDEILKRAKKVADELNG